MQFSPFSCHLISPRSKHPSQHPVLNNSKDISSASSSGFNNIILVVLTKIVRRIIVVNSIGF
jgi:hypothetical protein